MLYVLADANVAIHDCHLLRKNGGIELVKMLRATGGQILLPDGLREEYLEQSVDLIRKHVKDYSKGWSGLETFYPHLPRFQLPTPEVAKSTAEEVLAQLEDILFRVESTEVLLAAAGRRSMRKIRPTSKSDHGFKDCLFWESVLALPTGSTVAFASRDYKAFFNDERTFHPDLLDEAAAKGITVLGCDSVAAVVKMLAAQHPDIDLTVTGHPEPQSAAVSPAFPPVTPMDAPGPAAEDIEAVDGDAIAAHLLQAQRALEPLDKRVYGLVSFFFSGLSLQDLAKCLGAAEVNIDHVQVVADRLALAGLVQKVGNTYFPVRDKFSRAAALSVEDEVIANVIQREGTT